MRSKRSFVNSLRKRLMPKFHLVSWWDTVGQFENDGYPDLETSLDGWPWDKARKLEEKRYLELQKHCHKDPKNHPMGYRLDL